LGKNVLDLQAFCDQKISEYFVIKTILSICDNGKQMGKIEWKWRTSQKN